MSCRFFMMKDSCVLGLAIAGEMNHARQRGVWAVKWIRDVDVTASGVSASCL